jgi:hypothetical protein
MNDSTDARRAQPVRLSGDNTGEDAAEPSVFVARDRGGDATAALFIEKPRWCEGPQVFTRSEDDANGVLALDPETTIALGLLPGMCQQFILLRSTVEENGS